VRGDRMVVVVRGTMSGAEWVNDFGEKFDDPDLMFMCFKTLSAVLGVIHICRQVSGRWGYDGTPTVVRT
jgi:hypothetical protein